MKKSVFAAGIALATLIGASASAATISLSVFDINDFNNVSSGGTVEDFESYAGANWDPTTVTNVGTFTSTGGTGSGSVCNAQSGGNCQSLFINDTVLSGQGNLVPLDGTKALSSNDTNGIFWNVFDNITGNDFSRIVFGLRDAADINGTIFTIETDDGSTATLQAQANNNEKLVVIDLGGLFSNATVAMFNNKANDGFTIDGATVSAVPLPAAGWMLIAGVGGLAAMRRRQKKAA